MVRANDRRQCFNKRFSPSTSPTLPLKRYKITVFPQSTTGLISSPSREGGRTLWLRLHTSRILRTPAKFPIHCAFDRVNGSIHARSWHTPWPFPHRHVTGRDAADPGNHIPIRCSHFQTVAYLKEKSNINKLWFEYESSLHKIMQLLWPKKTTINKHVQHFHKDWFYSE